LLFIDLDQFKQINDSLGHDAGDSVLIEVAKRIESVLRKADTLARVGGDEFTVVMEDLAESKYVSSLAQKILDILISLFSVDGNDFYISCSIGISIYPEDGLTRQDLLKEADVAMYRAKSLGRNNFQFFSSYMIDETLQRVLLESSLREAIKNEEFVVYYQPQMDGRDDTLIGMEALVRWMHPKLGLVPPFKFISVAEESGLIIAIDRLVMNIAMKQFTTWHNEGLNPGVLSLNLAMKQIGQKDIVQWVENALLTHKLDSKYVELEITEGEIMKDPEASIDTLNALAALGIKLAIDDFGTGYSSLAYLKRLLVHKLKIDKSFVDELPYDEEDVAITTTVIALAKGLKLNLIAEGVENEEQKKFLIEKNCYNIQGYLYSKPIPAVEMSDYLKSLIE
jgi:diguanylate cyclase (GGDEF)-like protein